MPSDYQAMSDEQVNAEVARRLGHTKPPVVPCWVRDMRAAWDLVERFKAGGPERMAMVTSPLYSDQQWDCHFFDGTGDDAKEFEGEAPTAARAICIAFLLATQEPSDAK